MNEKEKEKEKIKQKMINIYNNITLNYDKPHLFIKEAEFIHECYKKLYTNLDVSFGKIFIDILEKLYLKMEKRQSKKLIEFMKYQNNIKEKKVYNFNNKNHAFLKRIEKNGDIKLISYNNYFITKTNNISKKLCSNNNLYNLYEDIIIINDKLEKNKYNNNCCNKDFYIIYIMKEIYFRNFLESIFKILLNIIIFENYIQ